MHIKVTSIGNREFINFGDTITVPVDRIKNFDFMVSNGGATGRSVRIVTDDPEEDIIFAYENRDAIQQFLSKPSTRNQ